ncbi:pectate lyase family protein [Streptomyces xiamenensis]|uniref:pectate lyase family protein n=1 Tax=Streptomyces xiamenensis TaxID=408015 RepID=UPI0035DF4867
MPVRRLRAGALAGCAALAVGLLPLGATARAAGPAGLPDPSRTVLGAGDGWGAAEGGVIGGSEADRAHTYTVTDRAGLVAALNDRDPTPKIIKIRGTVDVNTDDAGRVLGCADYAVDGYTIEDYLAAYDPQVWGWEREPEGPLEDARHASQLAQRERVRLSVGSNTTIIGEGRDARLLGASLSVQNAENVIIRNLTLEDAADCFPSWDPTDGQFGNWNSEYDAIELRGSRHVWIDHNTFTDGRNPDSGLPHYFGRLYQQHDGLLDIVRGTDLVTVSWNVFREHDKTMIIGNGDGAGADDRGRLRITLHHNLFHNVNERAPRVRFGQVDVYNNHYRQDEGGRFGYSWGVGFESRLVAEHNAFTLARGTTADRVIRPFNDGQSLTARDNWFNGRRVDLIAAYHATGPARTVGEDAGWTPALRTRVDHPAAVPVLVGLYAGSGRLIG